MRIRRIPKHLTLKRSNQTSISSMHDCPKQQCTCSKVSELTKLYRELKYQRKRAREDNNDGGEEEEERECISAEELQMTRSQAEHVLSIVRTQRQGVGNLMIALRDFSEKLSKQEEMLCQMDKEIAELREEMRRMREQYEMKEQVVVEITSADEVAWRQALDSEVREQCRLKNKIKQLTERLERRKRHEQGIDEARQEERRTDAKVLLNAMDYVERCIQE